MQPSNILVKPAQYIIDIFMQYVASYLLDRSIAKLQCPIYS